MYTFIIMYTANYRRYKSARLAGKLPAPKPSSKQLATKSYVKRYIRKGQELKHKDHDADTTASTTPTFVSLTAFSAGTSDNQRVGSAVQPIGLDVVLQMLESDNTNVFRVILFQWLGDDGDNPPTQADLLATTGDVISQRQYHRRKQYRLISDQVYSSSNTGNSNQIIVRKKYKLQNFKQCRYDGTTTDGNNMIYMMFMSDSAAVTHPTFNYRCRLYYTDD